MYRTEIAYPKGKSQKWLLCQSDCPEDVYDFIKRNKPWAVGGNADCLSTGKPDGWADTKDLNHALELGRFGWAGGRKQMIGEIEAANLILRALPRRTDAIDVAGSYPIVPLAVAGDPCNMVTKGIDSTKTKPIVRIVVNAAVSGAVSVNTIIKRGAAILSWIDELESAGIRCDVEVIETGLFREHDKEQLGVLFSMTGKLSHEPVDIDRLSFLLCHPAIQRRIFFSLYEREASQAKIGLTQAEAITYGAPTDEFPSEWIGQHSIYFPAMKKASADWASPAMAIAAVERAVMAGLQLEDATEFNQWGD